MMITLAQRDVLRALKRCLCLTRQDILLSDSLNDSSYWKSYAAARHNVYHWLQSLTLEHGVNYAYLLATERYDSLPLFNTSVAQNGEKEALEVFFLFIAGECPSHAQIHA